MQSQRQREILRCNGQPKTSYLSADNARLPSPRRHVPCCLFYLFYHILSFQHDKHVSKPRIKPTARNFDQTSSNTGGRFAGGFDVGYSHAGQPSRVKVMAESAAAFRCLEHGMAWSP